ncbi:MAG: hypothetical protein AAGH78_17605 [Cyanobacteria bacterium P01_H01_bin.58]
MYQSNQLDFKLVQRVCLLQQALDQALDSLAEMQGQVKDKHWIETQLANTEQYANTQQQAIQHLKQHVGQFTAIQQQLLGVMLHRLTTMIDQQQTAFSRLQTQIAQGKIELQTYLQYLGTQGSVSEALSDTSPNASLKLEAEVMVARSMTATLSKQFEAAETHLSTLTADLQSHHLTLNQIVQTLQAMLSDLSGVKAPEGSEAPLMTQAYRASCPDHAPAADAEMLQSQLRRQELKTHELEALLVDQFEQHARLKHRIQALAAERDHYKRQLAEAQQAQQTSACSGAEANGAKSESAIAEWPPIRRQKSNPAPIPPLQLHREMD